MSSATTSHSIRIIADLVDNGVNLTQLDSQRRESYRKSLELTHYKGQLLQRIETYLDNKLSLVVIPWSEIQKYSPLYNPSMLVQEDMRLIEGNVMSVAIKLYSDGHITGKVRAAYGHPIAAKLAEHFGGGGHEYSSGFKTTNYSSDELKAEIIKLTSELINETV
jgi:nanoRNase/pAp phosphatase (c-di-AMP/oligoRNAs hydrolase)